MLWQFGRTLESVWGSKRFILFYVACGIGAGILHMAIQYFRCSQLADALMQNDSVRIENLRGAVGPMLGGIWSNNGCDGRIWLPVPKYRVYDDPDSNSHKSEMAGTGIRTD
ncbi:MAG: rhomboid family intramembrane serine protease [Chitinophagaceae bacterium]